MVKFKLPYQDDTIEQSFFRFPKFAAKHLGFWPGKEKTVAVVFRFVFHATVISTTCSGQFASACSLMDDLMVALDAICPFATMSITTVKMLIFFFRSENIKRVIARMRKTLFEETLEEDIEIIREHALKVTYCASFVFWSGIFTNFFYNVPPLTRIAINHFTHQNQTWEFPFKVVFPRFLDDMYHNSWPVFAVTYAWCSYSGCIAVFGFTGVDGVFFGFCLYISAKFKCLQNKLNNTFKEMVNDAEFLSFDENTKLIRELSKVVQAHNDLITLTQDFAHLFTIIILGHFVTSGFVICVSSLNLMLVESYLLKAIYFFYNACVITQLFIYCSGGASIVDTSTEFADTAYFTQWYKCDVRVRKFIWLIIMRSQKSIELDVPFFAPSLPLFTAICRTAGSYIALLKTFV